MMPSDSTGTDEPGPIADGFRSLESGSLAESFERPVAALVDCIAAGERHLTTGEHGLRLLELERAVVRPAESGKRVEL